MPDTRQWLRKLSLIAAPSETADGLELSEMHVSFAITAQVDTTPATLSARIYNVSNSTAQTLKDLPIVPVGSSVVLSHSEPTSPAGRVVLRAGYEGNFGIIFKGELMQVRFGRDNGVDSYVDLFAADGDWGHVWGRINTTLAAGWKPSDVNDETRKALAAYGVTVDQMPSSIPQRAAPRGKVLFGRARDIQRDMGRGLHTDSFVYQGVVNWLPAAACKPGEAVKITSRTGMIGMPRQTNFGVSVAMLLNPSVGPGTLLQIDNRSIQREQFTATIGETFGNVGLKNNLDTDGFYKVLAVDHHGDTHGNDWYSTCQCVAVSPVSHEGFLVPIQWLGYGVN